MTPSQQAKEAGLKSLVQVSDMSKIPVSTLKDWHRNYPERFKFVLCSCRLKLINESSETNSEDEFTGVGFG